MISYSTSSVAQHGLGQKAIEGSVPWLFLGQQMSFRKLHARQIGVMWWELVLIIHPKTSRWQHLLWWGLVLIVNPTSTRWQHLLWWELVLIIYPTSARWQHMLWWELVEIIYGHSGTEGSRTPVTYFPEEGVFFETSACPRCCKRRVHFCTQLRSMQAENPLTIHEIYAALTPSDFWSDWSYKFAAATCCRWKGRGL